MIDNTRLLSFSDVVSALGCRMFTLSLVNGRLTELIEDTDRENVAFDILEQVRLLKRFRDTLQINKHTTANDLTDEDFLNLTMMNAAIVAFTISDISVNENAASLQSFLIRLVRSKKYDVSRLKRDCQIIMSDGPNTGYHEGLMKAVMKAPVNYKDVIELYRDFPEFFTLLDGKSTDTMLEAVTKDIDSINIYGPIEVIYNICQKKALSEYVQSKSLDRAINVYSSQFGKILEFVNVDLEQYVDRASESLVSIEEVIV